MKVSYLQDKNNKVQYGKVSIDVVEDESNYLINYGTGDEKTITYMEELETRNTFGAIYPSLWPVVWYLFHPNES